MDTWYQKILSADLGRSVGWRLRKEEVREKEVVPANDETQKAPTASATGA